MNESIELKGFLYLTNNSSGTLVSNHSGVAGLVVNVSIINNNTGTINSSYNITANSTGLFYSRSAYYPSAPNVLAPSTAGTYIINATYADPNNATWRTKAEILVVNTSSIDRLSVFTDKASYNASEVMYIYVEAMRDVGGTTTPVANVSVNGTIRNSAKTTLSTFTCTTGSNGRCTVVTTTPSSYGSYYVEVNNFKSFTTFETIRFQANILMRDGLGQTVQYIFNTGDDASVEVTVLTNSTTETYTFSGIVKNSAGTVVKNVTSTVLNSSNSYANRFTFTADAVNFAQGSYAVAVNVTKTGGGTVELFTAFELRSWDFTLQKKSVGSGFVQEYTAFPNKALSFEMYPTWRSNGSIISGLNVTTAFNISLFDKWSNQLNTSNATFNSSCGKEGCYGFAIYSPSATGTYYLSASVSYDGTVRTAKKTITVVNFTISAQTTDNEGVLKELFGTAEFVYITLTAQNFSTGTFNLSNASVGSVTYMNGSAANYTEVADFTLVNGTNSVLEWAWNASSQRLKLDSQKAGGVYSVSITGNSNAAGTSTRFIINPYDTCVVAKNTAGNAGGSTGYYYAYQFKTNDKVYFELRVVRADNPTGRATFANGSSNTSHGKGNACPDYSTSKQVVNNATITITEVVNLQTGKNFTLNTTESICQPIDTKGGYTCTVSSLTKWDGGAYGAKFKVLDQDNETFDIAYGNFEARVFYLYAWPNTWQISPTSNVALNVYMYEAGNNWWGSYGSGGLGGTVSLEKVEYMGSPGEYIWPPISYNYNTSNVNKSTITSGSGSLTLAVSNAPNSTWKSGSYRAVLKGTDSGGTSDYGYAWFTVRRWEIYSSPVECTNVSGGTGSCVSVYNINSKNNVTLYVTINNAGEWGQAGRSLGSKVTISVKKLQDCRTWPCADLNGSNFTATNINVTSTSGWYSSYTNSSYLINITPRSGRWGSGWWQVVLEANATINGTNVTESGYGWFNTIAFYAKTKPTDSTGVNWTYNIKNSVPMYFNITTVKSQKEGSYYESYNTTDFVNASIVSVNLNTWNTTNYESIKYEYPTSLNATFTNNRTWVHGSSILNLTLKNRTWPSGYYYGDITLINNESETATGWLGFSVQPFRVQVSSNQYSVDNTACVNGTIGVYEPSWSSNTLMTGTFNITSVYETSWSSSGSSLTTYTNYTPTSWSNGSTSFSICPPADTGRWGTGSWGSYHYLSMVVVDSSGNSETGWLSFNALPFSTSWGSIVGGTNVGSTAIINTTATLTKPNSGASTSGNLTKLYQWRYDNYRSTQEEYVFAVYNNATQTYCNSSTTASGTGCKVTGTQTVLVYPPTGGWKSGYNYLTAEWTESDLATSKIMDYSAPWFNVLSAYSGYWYNSDASGNWKYYFTPSENLTIRLEVKDSNNNAATVTVSSVEYAYSDSCGDEYCRSYTSATFAVLGTSNNQITGSGTLSIAKPAGGWTRGNIAIRATVTGTAGTITIKNGGVYVKDLTAPNITLATPTMNQNLTPTNATGFLANWTTTEDATCNVDIYNYDSHFNYRCYNWNAGNNTSTTDSRIESCNITRYAFNGTAYYYEYVSRDYHSLILNNGSYSSASGTTGLVTGGTTHYYTFNTSNFPTQSQHYNLMANCWDTDWNSAVAHSAFKLTPS